MTTKVFILDGAMGTILLEKGFNPPFENLCLTHPEVIKGIHQDYIHAGSEIILSHTFNAQSLNQCEAAWNMIKDLPAKKFISIGPEANRKLIIDYFKDKADQFVFETIYNLDLARELVTDFHSLNPIFSFCLKASDFKEALKLLVQYEVRTIGLNCLNGFEEAEKLLAMIPSHYEIYFKPNTGKENQDPENFAQSLHHLMQKFPLTYIGGCCGSTPTHIHEIQKVRRTFWQD